MVGAYAVFVFAFLLNFPEAIRQVFGIELITYGSKEATIRIAACVLFGRLIFLLCRDVSFVIARILVIQTPLALSKAFSMRGRKRVFRAIARIRKKLDWGFLLFVRNPTATALVISVIVYGYWIDLGWVFLPVLAFVFAWIEASDQIVEQFKARKARVKFRYLSALGNSEEHKQLRRSTMVLFAAFLIGRFESEFLLNTATDVFFEGNSYPVIFATSELAISLHIDENRHKEWSVLPITGGSIQISDP